VSREEGSPAGPWPAVLLVGPTGSGKTPLGDEMERRGLGGRPCVHFDFGANLRAAAGGSRDFGLTPLELQAVRASLGSGALFEDRDMPMIVKVLTGFVEMRRPAPGTLLVLNGLPRHRRQAEALSTFLAVERVISLEADAAVIHERIRLNTGLDRGGRGDDDLEAVRTRLMIFQDRTGPLLDFYRERGIPVMRIAVTETTTAVEMLDRVEQALAAERRKA